MAVMVPDRTLRALIFMEVPGSGTPAPAGLHVEARARDGDGTGAATIARMRPRRRRLLRSIPALAGGLGASFTPPGHRPAAAAPAPGTRDMQAAQAAASPAAAAAASPSRSAAPVDRPTTRTDPNAWPAPASVAALRARVGDALIAPRLPFEACAQDHAACAQVFNDLRNPYAIRDEPALTQSFGWIDAWSVAPSPWAVAARRVEDVVAAVDFARDRGLRVVVKGGGHSYLGTSNDGAALLIWTRGLDRIELHDAFVAEACAADTACRAVSLGAGVIWSEAYDAVSTQAGGYVQGGGCMTVGVAGLIQSGGFGSFSKAYGLASASLLEAEVITADGRRRIASARHEPDLFWALKGGGGGSFGVVTRLTLRVHPLPERFGAARFTIRSNSEAAHRRLIDELLDFCGQALLNPHWGEQIRFRVGHVIEVAMVFQGLTRAEGAAVWAPFIDSVESRSEDYRFDFNPLRFVTTDARSFWSSSPLKRLLGFIGRDERPDADPRHVFWPGDREQAGQVLQGYDSQWLPARLLQADARPALAQALYEGSRLHWLSLHLNKGLAGAPDAARRAALDTAVNPAVVDAFALVISAATAGPGLPGLAGHEPDVTRGREQRARVDRAMAPVRAVAGPRASYLSESDFFLENWAEAYWGANRARLARVKAALDPEDLFRVHHGVAPG